MRFSLKHPLWHLVPALLALALSSRVTMGAEAERAATISLEALVKPLSAPPVYNGYPVVLRVTPYSDQRATVPARKIGDIRATVVDMHATELIADQDVSGVVTAVMTDQLMASGFRTLGSAESTSAKGLEEFQISGGIKDFTMNIAGRDEVSIVVETSVRDARNGDVIWSGVVSEKTDRYAGVSGNTKNSIIHYLSGAVRTVASKTAAQISAAIRQTRPELFSRVIATTKAEPGVEVLITPPLNTSGPSSAQVRAAPILGRLVVTTKPARARIYLGDTYYGLSPLRLELEPSIHSLRLQLDGFKTVTEKVSVRKGETTELEVTLQK